jgi:hypothetical protein
MSVGGGRSDFGVEVGTGPAGRWIVDMTGIFAEEHIKNLCA